MSLFNDNCITTKFSDISKSAQLIWEGGEVEGIASFLRSFNVEDILMEMEIGCDYTTRFRSCIVNEKLSSVIHNIMRYMRTCGLEPKAVMNKCKAEITRQYDKIIDSLFVTCEGGSEGSVNINVYSLDKPVLKLIISDNGKKRGKR